MMKANKRARLEAAGWKVGSAAEFLELGAEEAAFVELKVALSQSLRQWRTRQKLTQGELAKRLRSSQSRVAKMEAADPTVSVDLLVRSLFRLGAKPKDIARAIA
jgi:predicted XRE-type DNA-binding protein